MVKGMPPVKTLKDTETVSLYSYSCFKSSDCRERRHLHEGTQRRESREKKSAVKEELGRHMW